jgi:adenosylcobinamide-GDP ribazoletransferase
MVIAMRIVPNSRNNGLSATVGKPQLISVYIAIITTFIIALICFGISGLLITLVGLLFALPVFLVAKAKIGGQTGDVLGASQKFAEIAALSTALIL